MVLSILTIGSTGEGHQQENEKKRNRLKLITEDGRQTLAVMINPQCSALGKEDER